MHLPLSSLPVLTNHSCSTPTTSGMLLMEYLCHLLAWGHVVLYIVHVIPCTCDMCIHTCVLTCTCAAAVHALPPQLSLVECMKGRV